MYSFKFVICQSKVGLLVITPTVLSWTANFSLVFSTTIDLPVLSTIIQWSVGSGVFSFIGTFTSSKSFIASLTSSTVSWLANTQCIKS